MTAQQIDALRDIVNKARVTAICKSPAWKYTLRILKRSRLVYEENGQNRLIRRNILIVIRCVICTCLT